MAILGPRLLDYNFAIETNDSKWLGYEPVLCYALAGLFDRPRKHLWLNITLRSQGDFDSFLIYHIGYNPWGNPNST